MISKKQLELPPEVARAFFSDVRAYFAEQDRHKRDRIAVYQLRALQGLRRQSHEADRDHGGAVRKGFQ